MKKAYVRVAAKLLMFGAMLFSLVSPAVAQTWQSTSKAAVIPVVVVNTACNNATDTVGITTDRGTLLTCQSGVWAQQAPLLALCGSVTTIGVQCRSSSREAVVYAGNDARGRLYVSLQEEASNVSWGPDGFLPSGPGGVSGGTSIYDGLANSQAVYAAFGNRAVAVATCFTKGGGWYLPAPEELRTILLNRSAVGGFVSYNYWTSLISGDGEMAGVADSSNWWTTYRRNRASVRCVRRD